MSYARARIAESLDELRALDAEIAEWHGGWNRSYEIDKNRTQIDFLSALTRGLIGILISNAGKLEPSGDLAAVYAECRKADEQLHYIRRLWRYYADKFDQRTGQADDPMVETLRAADEVIWSCWKTAIKSLGASLELYAPAPLAYLSPQFSASTTHRTVYPEDLRPSQHKVFQEHVRQLSIPVIALPPVCRRRPWWLVVAAHEVGHHLQWAIPAFGEQTQGTVTAAVGDGNAKRWGRWHSEMFADTCAVLLAGPAAIWAIGELATEDPGYPPPVVRLALARAVAEKSGLPASSARNTELPGPALFSRGMGLEADGDVAELLGLVPAVADALLGMTSDAGVKLRALADTTARAYDRGTIAYWEKELLGPDKPVPDRSLSAARFCVAGSVSAWQRLAGGEGSDQEFAALTVSLAGHVRGVLPGCAEPGTRAGLSGTDVRERAEELARRFAADLDALEPPTADEFAVEELTAGDVRP